MNVTSINQTSANLSVTQSKQDSHEKSIEQQILTLQEKMRNIAYDNEMPDEEKDHEKKSLQEKIQSLNSELKQYQIQKRQEEAEKRQQEAKKREEEIQRQQEQAARAERVKTERAAVSSDTGAVDSSAAAVSSASSESALGTANTTQSGQTPVETEQADAGFSDAESNAMISFSNTKEHLESMQKLYTSLEGQMRTAQTDAEKADIQKKMDHISKSMGEKIQKIADTINDTGKEDEARKEKVREKMQELREKRQKINAVVSNSSQNNTIDYGYWQKNAATLGKVLITRQK